VLAEQVVEHHRDCVGLLTGSAAGRPDADLLRVVLGREDPRQQLRAQVVPVRLVAEERRDVDQDRVEELDVLVRVLLERRAIAPEAPDAERLQAPLDPPRQARALVAREVEAAARLDVLEQLLERLVAWGGAHPLASPVSGPVASASETSTPRRVRT